ncbi:MAG TPA: Ig-like domain repeat protein, partial [Actinomycetes bacterium]|nr:Ig-like domain repeat protein [Actinomycetes bacterium]
MGNVSAPTSYTWTVNLSVPTIAIAFPTVAGLYNDSGFNAGCGTAATGDACGTADDDSAVTAVSVSLRRLSTGLYWNGTSFNSTPEVFLAATNPTDWTYAINATAFFEGDYTLRAQASDGPNFGYDSRTFKIDRTAPAAPTLTSQPPATSGPSATLAFTTSDPTAVFECQLDAGAWTSCPSPQTYSNLSHGLHAVAVRAVDGAGNTSPSTSTTWTVDATAPTAAMTFPTASSYNLPGWAAGCGTPATGDVCGTAGDVGSGLTAVAVSIRRASTNTYWNGSTFAAASETWLGATGTASWSYLFAGAAFPADGSYTVRWRATDAVGNATTGGVDLMLDTTPPPAPQITGAPNNPSGASVQFAFTDAEAGTGAECRMDSGAWATCTAPVDYNGLAEGSHTFDVRATDAAGNVSASTSYTWDVHLDLPTVVIAFPNAAGLYNDIGFNAGCGTALTGDVCGTASDVMGISAVNVSLRRQSTGLYWNGTTFTSATEVFLAATGTTSWSYAMAAASYPEDSYTLRARAADGAGNLGHDSLTFTIDRTAPAAPTLTTVPPPTSGPAATFEFTTTDPTAVFECRLDGPTWTFCSSPQTYGALADGSYSFDVRAVDGAGNVGATTSRTWTVDATAPTAAMTFPTATSYNLAGWTAGCGTPATDDVCGTASDVGSGLAAVEISIRQVSTNSYWNGTTFAVSSETWLGATGTASWSYLFDGAAFPADGDYTVRWRATDAVGNTTTAGVDLTLDTTPPPPPVLTNTPTNNESGDAVSF